MELALQVLELCEDYSYASTQFDLPSEVKKEIRALQKQIDSKDWTKEDGKETEIHLTVLWGITGGLSSKKLVSEIASETEPIEIETTRVEIFKPEGKDYEVAVVRVKSPALHALRKRLESGVPNKQTFPEYKPHITLGYVNKGAGKKYANLEVPPLRVVLDRLDYSTKKSKKTRFVLKKK